MDKKISVIIPIYNVEQYLGRCLESVINQTYNNLEIILVNDGTPDNSVKIAETYMSRDDRIILYHQENAGLSEARNTGVRYATGDYIAFLDSDDWLELDAYDYLIGLIEKHDADIAIGATRRTTSPSKDYTESNYKVDILTQKEYARKYFKIGSQTIEYYVWNKLYRRHIIEGTKQPKGLYAEDVPSTFMYLLKATKIVSSNKIIHHYFVNTEGLSEKFSPRHLEVLKGWDLVVDMAKSSGDADYLNWSIFNKKRANFALLTELALATNYDALIIELHQEIKKMMLNLRKDFKVLLSGPMPMNRKLLLPFWASNYFVFSKLINKVLRKSS